MNTITAATFILLSLTTALAEFSNHNARIINGYNAKRRQFPYQVSIQEFSGGKYVHSCGASLISTTRILTAAHCIISNTSRAVFGMLIQDEDHPDVQIKNITNYAIHPNYKDPSVNLANYDIAVLTLSSPVILSSAVQIAQFGTQEDCDAIETGLTSGWGLTNSVPPIRPKHLKYVTLPRISLEECKLHYAGLGVLSNILYGNVLCVTTNPGIIQGVCSSDSGGPLVRNSNKKLIGVVSLGPVPCEEGGLPTLYTSVCKHYEFINNNL